MKITKSNTVLVTQNTIKIYKWKRNYKKDAMHKQTSTSILYQQTKTQTKKFRFNINKKIKNPCKYSTIKYIKKKKSVCVCVWKRVRIFTSRLLRRSSTRAVSNDNKPKSLIPASLSSFSSSKPEQEDIFLFFSHWPFLFFSKSNIKNPKNNKYICIYHNPKCSNR